MFEHYREANVTQLKHHFWWMLNHVYANFVIRPNFTGHVLLLEEDFYVSPDALHILNLLATNRNYLCPECNLLVLGLDSAQLEFYENEQFFTDTVGEDWNSMEHFRGMALTGNDLRQIIDCAESFCHFDDYNYDFSLMHANLNCFREHWKTLRPLVPRVLHTGSCGFHRQPQEGAHCHEEANRVRQFFWKFRTALFPRFLNRTTSSFWKDKWLMQPIGYGGWADPRDRQLCMKIAQIAAGLD